MSVIAGDNVRILCEITRDAYYKANGKTGTIAITLQIGDILVAATDEIGGNLFVETIASDGYSVLVPLGEGEWQRA